MCGAGSLQHHIFACNNKVSYSKLAPLEYHHRRHSPQDAAAHESVGAKQLRHMLPSPPPRLGRKHGTTLGGMCRASGADASSTQDRSIWGAQRMCAPGSSCSLSEVIDKPTSQRDCHLVQLSAVQGALCVSVAALYEFRKLGADGSFEMGTSTTGLGAQSDILKKSFWLSPMVWSLILRAIFL